MRFSRNRKAWKFFFAFFLVMGVSFGAIEYAFGYLIVNGIYLYSPQNTKREWLYGLPPNRPLTLLYSLETWVVSNSIPPSVAENWFGLDPRSFPSNYDSGFSLTIQPRGSGTSYVLSPQDCSLGICGAADQPNTYAVYGLSFTTQNPDTIKALNNTQVENLTLTMTTTTGTNFYTQHIVRSTSISCAFDALDMYGSFAPCKAS